MQKIGQCYICGSEGAEYVACNRRDKDLDFSFSSQPFLIMFDGGYICHECHSEAAKEQAKDRSFGIENPFPEYVWARKREFDREAENVREGQEIYKRTFSRDQPFQNLRLRA
jgi:hypothetical protein